ncbi:MAG: Eco57I restriction-modification methylase domain-containing protein, partial [Bacteroidaceae bacterium]|nr:Eco57I restriction-modification methylase domain-containing protein [Bacteroidaceae bacterium]
AYNPETMETVRNMSGSFYTPREVVNYMVDESLIAYLGDTPQVRAIFQLDFHPNPEEQPFYDQLAQRLKAVKVLDPACGSGAFPMGLLLRMVELIKRLQPEADTYALKLALIERCLYGSDIQSIAAQITKLRFFISLICECDKDATKPNFGIPTLPNLETNFVTANSLIARQKPDQQGNLFTPAEIDEIKTQLQEVRHKHFSARSASAKSTLRKKDQELRERLAELLSDVYNFGSEEAQQLAQWNPYDQNAVSPFFDPEWMFGLNDGFDIVIGNPPYIQLQANKGELSKLYKPSGYATHDNKGDIYSLFYERGWQLLKEGGHLCYITSNKWMRAGYGQNTRQFLASKTNPKLLIDFAGVKVFESATVDTNILLFARAANEQATTCAVLGSQLSKSSLNDLSLFVEQNHTQCAFADGESWV